MDRSDPLIVKIVLFSWLLICIGTAFFFFSLSSVLNSSQPKYFEIKSGDGFMEIAADLRTEGIIRSRRAFMIYGVLSSAAHQLKPGEYLLSAGSSTPAILNMIERGPIIDKSIFIPEGATLKDMDKILSDAKIIQKNSLSSLPIKEFAIKYPFLKNRKSFEGFLFPDTYKFFLNSRPEDVAEKMLDNFSKKVWPILEECQKSKVKCQMSEVLIIASLLEKEVPDYEDRRMVAGVLYKRLDIGMGLQVDATIVYAKCGGLFITCENPKVLKSDLTIKSLYNTYLYRGLPPGPIGNPGIKSIRAALDPVKSDYLYYLSDPKTKKTIFSRTLEEHNENRVKYLGI